MTNPTHYQALMTLPIVGDPKIKIAPPSDLVDYSVDGSCYSFFIIIVLDGGGKNPHSTTPVFFRGYEYGTWDH